MDKHYKTSGYRSNRKFNNLVLLKTSSSDAKEVICSFNITKDGYLEIRIFSYKKIIRACQRIERDMLEVHEVDSGRIYIDYVKCQTVDNGDVNVGRYTLKKISEADIESVKLYEHCRRKPLTLKEESILPFQLYVKTFLYFCDPHAFSEEEGKQIMEQSNMLNEELVNYSHKFLNRYNSPFRKILRAIRHFLGWIFAIVGFIGFFANIPHIFEFHPNDIALILCFCIVCIMGGFLLSDVL